MTRSPAKNVPDTSTTKLQIKNRLASKTSKTSDSRQYVLILLVIFLMSVLFGLLHWLHVSQMHENDLFFSHLSSAERELTFRTEMGFYYSYFKQMIFASTFTKAWNSLLADTRSEFPVCPPSADRNGTHPAERSCPNLNAMQRFNLYPELILASAYRVLNSMGLLQSDCYRVSRELPRDPLAIVVNPSLFAQAIQNDSIQILADQTLAAAENSVISCTGLAEPAYFYTGIVFVLSGLSVVGLYLSGWLLTKLGSGSAPSCSQWLAVFGALLPMVAYFSNHREATRVQWTPPLRESFAYPFFAIQQAFLLYILSGLRASNSAPVHCTLTVFQALTYCSLLLGFQLPWQFSQFALCTQVASLLAACCLAIAIDSRRSRVMEHIESQARLVRYVRLIVLMHLIVLLINYALQFGNSLLLSSVYLPGIIGALVGLSLLLRHLLNGVDAIPSTDSVGNKGADHPSQSSPRGGFTRFLNVIAFPFAATLCTTILLFTLLNVGFGGGDQHDGGHIVDLLREKLQLGGHFHTFHTRLYTCAAEFDFIGWTSLEQPIRTGLLPTAAMLAILVLGSAAVRLFRSGKQSPAASTQPTIDSERAQNQLLLDFVSLFVVIQLLLFTVMAVLIMRLKLFWTPQMCLILALLAQPVRWHNLVQSVSDWWFRSAAMTKSNTKRTATAGPPRTTVGYAVLVLLIAYMSSQGWINIQAELNIRGQFSAFNEEVLIDWFSSLPPPPQGPSTPWVISGPMSTLGNLRLMLPAATPYPSPQPITSPDGRAPVGFAFTNHPHYENAELRRRTILANAVYSRKSVHEMWQIYRYQLQANFVIMEPRACHPRGGCSMPELYDLVDPHLANRASLCEALLSPDVTDYALTPPTWKPYFDVVYVEPATGRVVLYVRPVAIRNKN